MAGKSIPTDLSYSFLCSFIVSHPLYLSYFIFFSPYLFRFIFFISPLFLTTSLLLLLSLIASSFPQSKLGFIQTIIEKLRSKINDADNDDRYEFRHFEDLEIYQIVFHDPPLLTVGDGNGEVKQVSMTENAVTVMEPEEERRLERLFEELDRFEASTPAIEMKESESVGELQKLAPISGDYKKIDENSFSVELESNPWRLESSSSFGSCGSTARSDIEEVIGELQILEPVNVSSSGEDQKTVKSNPTAEIEMKNNETASYEPVTSSISGEYQKTVKSSEMKDYKTTSHARGVFQKSEPVTSSISVKDQKTVKSNLTAAAVETKKNNETASYAREVTSAISVKDQKNVKSNLTAAAAVEMKKNNETASYARAMVEMKNNETASYARAMVEMKNNETASYGRAVMSSTSLQNSPSLQSNSWRLESSSSFGSYGSMRKEREWKRTLACKLFEERNNSEGGEEGMDSLWEAYEDDNSSKKSMNYRKETNNKNNNNIKKKKGEFKYFDEEEEEEDDDEDEFMSNGQLCCLKALKLSTGKMNLGMGKPNLVKISKALKGFGWLHHVGSKHGKKH